MSKKRLSELLVTVVKRILGHRRSPLLLPHFISLPPLASFWYWTHFIYGESEVIVDKKSALKVKSIKARFFSNNVKTNKLRFNMVEGKVYRGEASSENASCEAQPRTPLVAVVMGSDTDLATLKPGLTLLDTMDIPYEVHITSAHRTPQYMLDFGRAAASRGFKVIIAAAGGAAHLPGMIASETTLPVIGVPVKASSLDGLDSLLSIVSMPRGIPVATVGIGNSTNAAVLAARIVGTSDAKAAKWVAEHLKKMDDDNMEKEHRLQREGWQTYQKLDS